ncbi:DnaJ protein [Lachnellula occidentalis]|uniref:DnaJ protein n=1 Tax=Lachnellula occidentalis TaxID=215460 RepID=A0A8H8RST2_9HELO|nr:DnaJ protein [Lachnellula occidentalis]
MALNLPADPYKALGVSKDAQLPEIRSAHRKLVLKCHPDKVQDAALKAIKQDEFQQVQQAYELLSDEKRREQYDEQLKLFELRKEMGRGNPTPRSNPFEYEIRTAEPRPNPYPRTKPSPQASPKVYSQTPPRSYEDVMYDEPKAMPRKTASYESTDRKRNSARDEDRRKHEDEEKSRLKFEKEREKDRKHAHSKKEKSRDKEKRRGTEEKHSRQTAYVHDESDEYVPPRPVEKKSSRHRADDELRQREAERVSIKEVPLAPKYDKHMEFAGQYMQAARRKGSAPVEDDFVHPGPLRRAETFAAPSYNVRHVAPQFSDDDTPRRSSARKESKRASEAPTPRTRDKSSKASSRRSPASPPKDPYIVEPPSPPPVTRKPTLQTRSSAPPDPTSFSSSQRDRVHRSKTQDYPRNDAIPPLPRAQTYTTGDRKGDPSRDRGGSRLKKTVDYSSAESDSDSPTPQPQRRSHSPPPRRPAPPPEPTRYIIDNGRSVPITRHRSELRDLNEDHYQPRDQPRDRSESPHGRRSRERSSGTRNSTSRQIPIRSQSQNYYPPDAPDPVIHTVRPKMPPREGTHLSSRTAGGAGLGGGASYFNDVKYAPKYTTDNLIASGYLSEE